MLEKQRLLVGQRKSGLWKAHLTACSALFIYVAMCHGLYDMGAGRSLDGSAFLYSRAWGAKGSSGACQRSVGASGQHSTPDGMPCAPPLSD